MKDYRKLLLSELFTIIHGQDQPSLYDVYEIEGDALVTVYSDGSVADEQGHAMVGMDVPVESLPSDFFGED